ncbi:hypothetical protein, partial [Lactobacillus amylovorus]|uniref:hypothetical protein n=1 Tax=Lactobacillus amylovorus TaxID=1604 RepID=UPI003F8F03AD
MKHRKKAQFRTKPELSLLQFDHLTLNCSDPRNSDMNLEGFTMSKLTKKDKIHIFEEWTLENKR